MMLDDPRPTPHPLTELGRTKARGAMSAVMLRWVSGAVLALAGPTVGGGAALATGTGTAAQAPDTVDAFVKGFSELKGFEARFVETKTMALLAVPLVTEGRLYFAAPDRLLRVVEKPQPGRVLVTPDAVTIKVGDQRQRIDLASQPEARSLVASLLSLFRGDIDSLRATYRLAYSPRRNGGWKLDLTPRAKRLSALIKAMRFEGRGQRVERITIDEASGDQAITEIVSADPERTFSPAERKRLFETP